MRVRYESWVKGLKGDSWCRVSTSSVPDFPWYRVDADGQVNYDDIITPPLRLRAPGRSVDRTCGGLHGRSARGSAWSRLDIMDTWATSSAVPAAE